MTAYATLDDLKAALGVAVGSAQEPNVDAYGPGLLEQASRYLDEHCLWDFLRHPATGSVPDSEARIFDGSDSTELLVHAGLVRVDTVETASATNGAWTALDAANYITIGSDMPVAGAPDDGLLRIDGATWGTVVRGIRITGVFGWAAVPATVKQATLDLARELYRQGPGGGGPIGVTQFGTPIFGGGVPRIVSDAIERFRRRLWLGV